MHAADVVRSCRFPHVRPDVSFKCSPAEVGENRPGVDNFDLFDTWDHPCGFDGLPGAESLSSTFVRICKYQILCNDFYLSGFQERFGNSQQSNIPEVLRAFA